jgi:predicted transport protein
MANVERSIVGDLINFRGLVYAPQTESAVLFLFGKVAEDLNMFVEEMRPEAPDAIVRRFTGKGWERLRVEFEQRSSDFRQRGRDAEACDLIVCWENDWPTCPLEVVELRDRIREMKNAPIRRPDLAGEGDEGEALDEWFSEHRVQDRVRGLFQLMTEHVRSVDETCFYKVNEASITFHSPQRAFMHVHPQPNALRLALFTGGESLAGVEPMESRNSGRKWGTVTVGDEDQLQEALLAIEEAHKRINAAIKRNERTGWHAKVEGPAEAEAAESYAQ